MGLLPSHIISHLRMGLLYILLQHHHTAVGRYFAWGWLSMKKMYCCTRYATSIYWRPVCFRHCTNKIIYRSTCCWGLMKYHLQKCMLLGINTLYQVLYESDRGWTPRSQWQTAIYPPARGVSVIPVAKYWLTYCVVPGTLTRCDVSCIFFRNPYYQ